MFVDRSRPIAQPPRELRSVGHGIIAPETGWTFGGRVWQNFDEHIRASVPGYDALHETIVQAAQGFLHNGGSACDFGCSTGTLTAELATAFPRANVVGVDIEPTMVRAAKRLERARPRYLCRDLTQLVPPGIDRGTERCALASGTSDDPELFCKPWTLRHQSFLSACYTMMFVPVAQRLSTLETIRRCLKPEGAFVLAEKVVRRNPEAEQQCQAELFAFKRAQGLTEPEIQAKSSSIRHCLWPLFDDQNVALLYRAGFRTVHRIFSRSSFDAWLAVS